MDLRGEQRATSKIRRNVKYLLNQSADSSSDLLLCCLFFLLHITFLFKTWKAPGSSSPRCSTCRLSTSLLPPTDLALALITSCFLNERYLVLPLNLRQTRPKTLDTLECSLLQIHLFPLHLYSHSIFLPGVSPSPTSILVHKGCVEYHPLPGSLLKFLISALIHFSLLLASIVLPYSIYSKIDSVLHFPTVTYVPYNQSTTSYQRAEINVHTSLQFTTVIKQVLSSLSKFSCLLH